MPAKGRYPATYFTSYCNFRHRMTDGSPIGHECQNLPVAALRAEYDGDCDRANDVLQEHFYGNGKKKNNGKKK